MTKETIEEIREILIKASSEEFEKIIFIGVKEENMRLITYGISGIEALGALEISKYDLIQKNKERRNA